MPLGSESQATRLRIRPRRVLLRNLLLSAIVGGVPLFGVLFWLSITKGDPVSVLVAFALFSAIILFAVTRFYSGFVEIAGSTITKQAFFKRTVVHAPDVASTEIAYTYRGSSHETLPQFVAKDASGAVLFRMRGLFWSAEDMTRLAQAIDATTTTRSDPITLKEFYALSPGTAYWYEGKPWVGIAGIAVAFVVALAIAAWMMMAIGVPIALVSGVMQLLR